MCTHTRFDRAKSRRAHKQRLSGGAIVGLGKNSTVVYTIDELFDEIRNIEKICVFFRNKPGNNVACVEGGVRRPQADHIISMKELQNAAIKDAGAVVPLAPNTASSSASSRAPPSTSQQVETEIVTNAMVFDWFDRAHKLHLTSLHRSVSHLVVFHKTPRAASGSMLVRRLLPVTDLKDENLRDLVLTTALNDALVVRMMTRALEFLSVLHSHGHVHLDIKPENIFVTFDPLKLAGKHATLLRPLHCTGTGTGTGTGTAHRSRMSRKTMYSTLFTADSMLNLSGGEQEQQYDFCLADYDTMERAAYVTTRVQSRQQRYFSQGTDGFMSPLITKDGDDSENGVFPKFKQVAIACGVAELPFADLRNSTHDEWATFFSRAKDDFKANVWKLDLHSLALTVLDIIPDVSLASTQRAFPRAVSMLDRLMFFRKGTDFFTADGALQALRSPGPTRKSTKTNGKPAHSPVR